MVSPKRTLQHTPADCLGRLLSAWLLAAAMEYLLLPAASRSLAELLAPANMRLPRVLLMTLAAFILLTLCSTFAPIRRFRRWVPFGNFFLLSVLSLAASFQPVYLGACCLILAVLAVYGAKGWDASPRSLSPAPRRRSDRAWVLASAVLAVLFLLLVSIWTVARYKAFCTSTYDFGIFAQMFHSMRTGGTPLTTLERDGLLSHFQVHVSPSYYLLLPFYCLYPHPETLQVLQAAVLASAVIPMWKLARLHGRSAPECFLLCAIVLLFPPVSAGTGYDIHENCLLLPGLLWLLYAADKKLPWLLAISALLTLGIKEDAAVYVAVAGLYILLRGLLTQKAGRWDRLAGGALTAGAVVWFLAVTAYLATSGDGVMNYRYANFLYNGSNSLVTVIFAVIMCPMKAVYECADPVKLGYLSVSLLPLLGLPLLTRRYERYLLLIPYILVNLMSDYTYQHNIFFQYSDQFVIFCKPCNTFFIYRLYKTSVYERAGIPCIFEILSYFYRFFKHMSHTDECDPTLLADHLAFAIFDWCTIFNILIVRCTSWITDCHRCRKVNCKLDHIGKFPFILRCHDRHVRNT